jgi:anti-sigma factor RsiW
MTGDARTMTCDGARTALLQADLDELRWGVSPRPAVPFPPTPSTPLARHLEDCPRCRANAAAILEAEAGLGIRLARPGRDPHVAGILAEVEEQETETEHTSGIRRRALRWTVPAALAAGLAGLLLARSGPPAAPGPARGEIRTALTGSRAPGSVDDLDLEVPPGTDAAVFTTADPDIKVIWFMGGDR